MELDRDAVDRVLRRASDMTADHPAVPGASTRMSEAVLLEAAAEAGLDPDAVRTSLAIERLGPTDPARRFDRTLGPRRAAVERIIGLDVDTLLGRLDDLLQRQHGLRRSRSGGDWGEWRKRTDALGTVQRIARAGTGNVQLRRLQRIEARASVIDGGRTILRLIADRTPQRNEAIAGGSVVGGLGVAVVASAAVLTTPIVLAATPVAVVAGAATARTGRRRHADLVADLEGLLDTVERGVRPITLTDDVRRVLRQLRR
ncbi:MAG: hypothetical protein F2534_01400 [Actinobacteria bacterium]|nr:hypothetical protein [Actinomycetota bacterium]